MIEAATLFGVPPDVSLSSTFMHSLLHRYVHPLPILPCPGELAQRVTPEATTALRRRFATDAKHLQDAAVSMHAVVYACMCVVYNGGRGVRVPAGWSTRRFVHRAPTLRSDHACTHHYREPPRQALDLWVSTATNGRVTSLLKDLPSAFAAHMADPSRPVPILLASVLHFTGHWAPSNEFDPACTTRDTFKLARGTTSGCYMMRALVRAAPHT